MNKFKNQRLRGAEDQGRRLRLLCLAPQEPWPAIDGGKEGILGAVEALAEDADITLACPSPSNGLAAKKRFKDVNIEYRPVAFEPIESLSVVLSASLKLKPYKFYKYCTSKAEKSFDRAIGPLQPDAIVCFHAHMEELGQRLRSLRGWQVPIVVREHNIEFEMVKSYLNSRPFWERIIGAPVAMLTRRAEITMWGRAELVAFLTDRDFHVGRASGANGNLLLAPEGVPLPPRRSAHPPTTTCRLLIPLNRKAPQSVSSLNIFLREYWRGITEYPGLQEIQLVITGVDAGQLSELTKISEPDQVKMNIVATGFLPSLQPTFETSLLVIAPTFVGGGIRKKVLEAMANQVPVMGTEMDLEACSYFKEGQNILRLGTPEEFRRSVVNLRQDPMLWQRLSDNGRATVENHANWGHFAEIMLRGIREIRRVNKSMA